MIIFILLWIKESEFNGKFICAKKNRKDILSQYEASYLRTRNGSIVKFIVF
jgi:hypothetical protein